MTRTAEQTLYWRLNEPGATADDAISVVLTHRADGMDLPAAPAAESHTVYLQWTQQDLDLFFALLHGEVAQSETRFHEGRLEVNLRDAAVRDILRQVAAARFGIPLDGQPYLNGARRLPVVTPSGEVGQFVGLDTTAGFKPAVVVGQHGDALEVLMLDGLPPLRANSKLTIPRDRVLPAELLVDQRPTEMTLH